MEGNNAIWKNGLFCIERYSPTLSSALWNALGRRCDGIQVDAFCHELAIGGAMLLCTDGLTDHVTDEQIEEVINCSRTAKQACLDLVDLANQSGGSDNITVVVARFQSREQMMQFGQGAVETDFDLDPELIGVGTDAGQAAATDF